MAYDHFQIEEKVANHAALGTAGSFFFTPAYQPAIVRAIAVVVTVAIDTADEVFTITRRVTAGSDSGEVAVDTLTVPSGTAAGAVIYLDNLEVKVVPGEELEIAHDGGTTNGVGTVSVFYQPGWENPSNNADMTATA